MHPLRFILSAALVASCAAQAVYKTTYIPANVRNTTASVQFSSTPSSSLDEPKISSVNSTVYDCTNASITVVFYAAEASGFPIPNASYTPVEIRGSLANCTAFSLPFLSGTGATVWTQEGMQGVSGIWHDTGAAFYKIDDLGRYTIVIDSENMGLKGVMNFNAIAPAHYPCGLLYPGSSQNMELMPGVGWANAMPDAIVTADLTYLNPATNEPLQVKFDDGIGYHDKNWGSVPFVEATQSWYWGHGRIGNYSVVWFDAIDWNGTEYQSGYVVTGNTIVAGSCNPSSSKVRPFGNGSSNTYPPKADSALPSGFFLEFELPGETDPLIVTVPNDQTVANFGFYTRWIGHNLSGSIGGRSVGSYGTGQWEQFNMNSFIEQAKQPS
ncbi:hypothetical protein V1517DRAFT_349442 [Lipomyces orientalis]|uniref:Uncharacterized protein n=1 Tax=Lipomyces orientalis TaxID=1233043 RepID=A0ACC3TDU0_9ASCO